MNGYNRQKYHYHISERQSNSTGAEENRTIKYLIAVVFIIILLVVIILLHINQYAQLSRGNLKVERLKEERNNLKSEIAHLQLKVSNLMSLNRVERLAKTELGMKEPEKINYIVVKSRERKDSDISLSSSPKEEKQVKEKESWPRSFVIWFKNLTKARADALEK